MFRILGVALLATGVVLVAMGVTSSEAFGSQVSTFFSGRPTDRSVWLMMGGAFAILGGAGALVASRGPLSRN